MLILWNTLNDSLIRMLHDDTLKKKRYSKEGLGGLVVRCRPRGWRAPGSKPDSTEDPPRIWDRFTPNPTYQAKRPLAGVVRKFRKGVPTQAQSTPSDGGSKLRCPSQNSSRIANVSKLN
ncbi:hypothetical protein AVEN_258763-1 [Araneus ventricosus]|uniref:Uncharacterized protein n=1 Tax=Araneus ventricosus TaxID=182803 RepID=A0A4Y2D0C3_ARAVE|nr:hypothetical protein AVEN_258763-1 [Araneus ventricosus]